LECRASARQTRCHHPSRGERHAARDESDNMVRTRKDDPHETFP
jgi:hypothetical protein